MIIKIGQGLKDKNWPSALMQLSWECRGEKGELSANLKPTCADLHFKTVMESLKTVRVNAHKDSHIEVNRKWKHWHYVALVTVGMTLHPSNRTSFVCYPLLQIQTTEERIREGRKENKTIHLNASKQNAQSHFMTVLSSQRIGPIPTHVQ